MAYYTVVTDAGAELIAQCIAEGGQIEIIRAAVGDGGGEDYEPDSSQTELKNTVWSGSVSSVELDTSSPNMINIRFEIPTDVGGFVIREAGVYTDDGTMIAVCNVPDYNKTTASDGMLGRYVIVMHVVVADSSVVAFYINPALDYVTRDEMTEILANYTTLETYQNTFAYDESNERVTISIGG